MEKPDNTQPEVITCPNLLCHEGTIEVKNGAETAIGVCPDCQGVGKVQVKHEIKLSVCMIVGKEEGNLRPLSK